MSLPKEVQRLLDLIETHEEEIVDTVKSPAKMKLGYMYLQVYDPKWKRTLPFYDVLPLYVLLAKKGDRVLGLNLHYMPYTWRVAIAKELMRATAWKKRIQYKDIKAAFNAAKVPKGFLYLCIRTYLHSHIRSQIKEFHSQNYEMAVKEIMPRFKKETEVQIYKILMSKFYKKAGGIKRTSKK